MNTVLIPTILAPLRMVGLFCQWVFLATLTLAVIGGLSDWAGVADDPYAIGSTLMAYAVLPSLNWLVIAVNNHPFAWTWLLSTPVGAVLVLKDFVGTAWHNGHNRQPVRIPGIPTWVFFVLVSVGIFAAIPLLAWTHFEIFILGGVFVVPPVAFLLIRAERQRRQQAGLNPRAGSREDWLKNGRSFSAPSDEAK